MTLIETVKITFSFSVATREIARPILKDFKACIRPYFWNTDAQRGKNWAVPFSSSHSANAVHIILLFIRQGDIYNCKWRQWLTAVICCKVIVLSRRFLLTVRNTMDINSSSSYICANQESYVSFLREPRQAGVCQ